jgi:hypothetical protein
MKRIFSAHSIVRSHLLNLLALSLFSLLAACDNNKDNPVAPQLPFKSVHDFGAKGDGIADDTTPINNALTGGGDVYFPTGTYRISSALRVNAKTTLRGAGRGQSIIRMTKSGEGNTIDVTSNNVMIYALSIEGPSPNETYVELETAIRFHPPTANERLQDVQVKDCEIYNYGFHGIELDHVGTANISGNRIHRIGYAGVMCLSGSDVLVNQNVIESIKPGTQGNAYGVAFTHSGKVPTAENPVSTRCIASENLIRDIPIWEGLDTHDGTFITFANNIVEGCRIGIMAGAVEGSDEYFGNISITGNTVVAGQASHTHYGIVLHGTSIRYARNCLVANNIVDGYGILGNKNSGAIHFYRTGGPTITGNVVENFAEAGIHFWHDNTNFVCSGNLVSSGISSTQAYSISVSDANNRGFIIGNRLNGLQIYVNPNVPNEVTIGDNDF